MLGEAELNKLDRQLSEFTVATKARQDALEQLTLSYGKLLEDYRSLRSDFEEEKEAREKYKKLARGQERNPFVLVLIDADGYVFEDTLIQAGAEGGVKAAGLLNEAIRDRLSRYGPEYINCRIMVRAYTNLAGLSKTLARAGLTGNEARSLAPFCANFTRAYDLFDFVDAGDKKENADFKIREMFNLFVENGQCKHIFFAGCHDTGYLNLLTPHIGRSDRITLVRGSSFSPEFQTLGLGVDGFYGLFRNNPLDGHDNRRPTLPKASAPSTPLNGIPNGYPGSAPAGAQVCTHYLRGICKFGNNCKKSHVSGDSWRPNGPGHASRFGQTSATSAQSFNLQQTGPAGGPVFAPPNSGFNTPAPSTAGLDSPTSGIALPSPGFGSSAASTAQSFPSPLPSQPHVQPSVTLPRPSPETANLIPVNKDGYRLDFYLQSPSNEDWMNYQARIKVQKLCNEYQLKGECRNGENCGFDHSPISESVKHVLRTIVHDYPCGRRGTCRVKNCNMGHICYREKCGFSNGKISCKLNRIMHTIDPVVAQWVPVEENHDIYSPDAFGITIEEVNGAKEETEVASEPPQSESGVGLQSYSETHPSDLD